MSKIYIAIVIIILLVLLIIPSQPSEKGIVVFGSSSDKVDEKYLELGRDVGRKLSNRIIIYSGGNSGIVGQVAKASIQQGGKVFGVTTKLYANIDGLQKGLYKLYIEPNLSIRKQRFEELAESYIILPGGFGTLDEAAEVITKSIWEDSSKPIVIFNYDGYYDPLIQMFENIKVQRFGKDYSNRIKIITSIDELN